jgi:hypothetical protein
MRKLIALALLALATPASAQLSVQLTNVPATTRKDATIYIAGSFNRLHPNTA